MLHCPYCGAKIKEDETYCVTCGRQLPHDIKHRIINKKRFNKLWFIPVAMIVTLLLSSSIYYLFLQNQASQAKGLYEQGEKHLKKDEFKEAKDLFQQSLRHKRNFKQAEIAINYIEKAITVKSALHESDTELEQANYQQALILINEAENNLKNYTGSAVAQLISELELHRNAIKIEQLKSLLDKKPSIDDLKILLWEADAIKSEEAEAIVVNIRDQIVDYTFSKASEELNKRQFSDAQLIVEDGLKYAPESEKLHSLESTIEKERFAFETTQQERIEQAINTAEEERELNETDAIELMNVHVENDDQDNLVVKGQVKSVATIPINSVLITYSLATIEGTEFLSNEVYVFPDNLYPDENGKFEFTHYDINENAKNITIDVENVTWYTE